MGLLRLAGRRAPRLAHELPRDQTSRSAVAPTVVEQRLVRLVQEALAQLRRPVGEHTREHHRVIAPRQRVGAEVAGANIFVNAIAPGGVATPVFDDYLARLDEESRNRFFQMIPAGRLGIERNRLAFLPNGTELLVTGERAQRLLRVQLASGDIDSSMTTGQATSHMVAATPDGARAYTANITGMSVSALDVPSKALAVEHGSSHPRRGGA